ncbi:hypothetical protein B0J14DRAFT_580772 [Halenospora varia]|nr:hypothetical protein B0J14DRAFT_580772 [Halenospora varia]
MATPTRDILTHVFLNPKTIKGVTAFKIRVHPKHCYPTSSGRFLPDVQRTIGQVWADRDKYTNRKDPFWWTCLCKKETWAMKRTIRSWLARRVRNAMVESLKAQGLSANGTRLDPSAGKDLVGSAQLVPNEPLLKMPYEELQKETDAVVKFLVKEFSKANGGMSKGSQHKFLKPKPKPKTQDPQIIRTIRI